MKFLPCCYFSHLFSCYENLDQCSVTLCPLVPLWMSRIALSLVGICLYHVLGPEILGATLLIECASPVVNSLGQSSRAGAIIPIPILGYGKICGDDHLIVTVNRVAVCISS